MLKLRHLALTSILPLALILPFWLVFGRGLLGVAGWLTILYVIVVTPVLFIALIILWVLVKGRADVKKTLMLTQLEALMLAGLAASVLLHGFFLVDGGDTDESIKSVATTVFGGGFLSASELIAAILGYLSMGLLATLLLTAIILRLKARRKK